ncbi:two-component system response regulator RppA [Nodosilinea nodulosa]|uniref:two-component system response regulator RppA n=1 Tax=Nodosilinea nodulosa TaxID=416001 RepID=UPI0002DCD0FD|nr:two-component system response regulator RppA [Nodosilinea nodulosa]
MRLLLVEDEPDLGAALKQVLRHEAYVVDWFLDASQAWNYLQAEGATYTLAVIDWMLPGMSGLELCRRFRSLEGNTQAPSPYQSVPILMLTARSDLFDKVIGLDAGADDYLTKPFGMPELLARLRALRRRSPQFQPRQLRVGGLTLNYGTHSASVAGSNGASQTVALTIKEFQLLEYFMRHPSQIVTRDQLLGQVWDMGSDRGSNVVAAQMRLLRRKLSEIEQAHLVETVYGVGYRFNSVASA